MGQGFFSRVELEIASGPDSLVPKCGACGLLKTCKSPKMPVAGDGKRRILIVGEAPGENEDNQNVPFVGKAGTRLRNVIADLGYKASSDCWITNAIICRPPNNRKPTDKEIAYCRPNLINAIQDLKPRVIIPLGTVAISALLGRYWKEKLGSLQRWVGWRIPHIELNTWICPSYHPSYLERMQHPVLDRHFVEHIGAAFELTSRPHDPKNKPDYESQVEVIQDSDKAGRILSKWAAAESGTIAFDYETNMTKPDCEAARIVSCAVCFNGRRTIAFPWRGAVLDAMRALLTNKGIKKVGYNAKFEERWTRAKLGVRVRGWQCCGMNDAHFIDNRREITSLKFQAFVNLGQPDYDSQVKPFLKSGGGNQPNQIHKVKLEDLLLYNGMDALLEYHLAPIHESQANRLTKKLQRAKP